MSSSGTADCVQIAAPAGINSEANALKAVCIGKGRPKGCKSPAILSWVKNFIIEDIVAIDSLLAASAAHIRGSNCFDGIVRNNSSNDQSHRIDFRGNTRISILNNKQYAYDDTNLEVFGNTTDSPKNIATTAPFKSGSGA